MSGADTDWLTANQRALSAALVSVRRALARHAARAAATADAEVPTESESPSDLEIAAWQFARPSALDIVCARFGLTSFERNVLLLAAGMELDSAFASYCERAGQQTYPTFGLALAALPGAHWSALQPDAPLRHWRLVELGPGGSPSAPVTTRPLRIDERILHFLTGLSHVDERLGVVTKGPSPGPLVPSHQAIADRLVAAWTRVARSHAQPAIVLHGPDPASARAIAVVACAQAGWINYSLGERFVPSNASELGPFVRLCEREHTLDAAAFVVECSGMAEDRGEPLRDFVDRLDAPVIVIARERLRRGSRPAASFEVARPTTEEQRALWSRALASASLTVPGSVEALTAQFSLGGSEIQAAVDDAVVRMNGSAALRVLWRSCRQQSRGHLEDLAERVDTVARMDDVVLPDNQKQILEDIVIHVRHRATVHDAWGFARAAGRGLGISALFAGASGTGKTMAAEVLAGALDLDLYRIDLSSVVSKYIGETEKNLRRIFDAADAGGVILLFDEADALFGKRSEVKDSHDRYANIEVSYLLQRMESYRGLAILTTNLKAALDTAFLRRLRFIVQFPFPDAAQRAEIWRRIFPPDTPTRALDVDRLAQLSVAGGSIRNVALKAAFLAADADEPVGMAHLLRAARSEYTKLEKPLTDAEVAGWV